MTKVQYHNGRLLIHLFPIDMTCPAAGLSAQPLDQELEEKMIGAA